MNIKKHSRWKIYLFTFLVFEFDLFVYSFVLDYVTLYLGRIFLVLIVLVCCIHLLLLTVNSIRCKQLDLYYIYGIQFRIVLLFLAMP